MRLTLRAFLVTGLLACAFYGLAHAEDLLTGGDLKKNWTTTGNWSLDKDGVATLTPRKGEVDWKRYDAYLWSKGTYTNFDIDFEYKVAKHGNSGFYFHVSDIKNPVNKGIEVQIYDSASKTDKDKLNDHDSGGIIPGVPPTKRNAKAAGEWNKMHVRVLDRKVTVLLNDEKVNDVSLELPQLKDRPTTGHIGFQDHGLPISLRNITIIPIK